MIKIGSRKRAPWGGLDDAFAPSPAPAPGRPGGGTGAAPVDSSDSVIRPIELARPKSGTPSTKPAAPGLESRDAARPTFARVYVGDGNALELVSLHVTVTVEGPRAAPSSTTSSATRTTASSKAPSSTRCRPAPARSYFAMFLGQTRDTAAAALRPPRRRPARCRRRPGQPDARSSSSSRSTPPTGAGCRRPASSPREGARNLRGSRPRPHRPGPAGVRRRQHLPRPRLPHPAQGLQPRPPRLRGDCCRSPAASMLYRFPLPDCKLTRDAIHPPGRRRGVQGRRVPAQGRQRTRAAAGSLFTHAWKETRPRTARSSSLHAGRPEVQAISGRQGENGPLYLYARLRPELKTVRQGEPFAEHAVFLLDTR